MTHESAVSTPLAPALPDVLSQAWRCDDCGGLFGDDTLPWSPHGGRQCGSCYLVQQLRQRLETAEARITSPPATSSPSNEADELRLHREAIRDIESAVAEDDGSNTKTRTPASIRLARVRELIAELARKIRSACERPS